MILTTKESAFAFSVKGQPFWRNKWACCGRIASPCASKYWCTVSVVMERRKCKIWTSVCLQTKLTVCYWSSGIFRQCQKGENIWNFNITFWHIVNSIIFLLLSLSASVLSCMFFELCVKVSFVSVGMEKLQSELGNSIKLCGHTCISHKSVPGWMQRMARLQQMWHSGNYW